MKERMGDVRMVDGIADEIGRASGFSRQCMGSAEVVAIGSRLGCCPVDYSENAEHNLYDDVFVTTKPLMKFQIQVARELWNESKRFSEFFFWRVRGALERFFVPLRGWIDPSR